MALFLVRSRLASVLRHRCRSSPASGLFSITTPELKTARVTSVLSHQYRSSSASGFPSTMMKTPTIKDASNHLNRTVEERIEKHRKVQQLAKDVNLLILSCESVAEGGVCDVYVVGFSSFYSLEAVKAAQAIMSYLKPQVLFLPFGYKPMLNKLLKYSPTNLIKAFVKKPIDDFRSTSILGFVYKLWPTVVSKLCPTVESIAYREAIKYNSNVVLGDRPEEITEERWELMPTCIQLDDIYLLSAIMPYEQEMLAWLIFRQLLEVARKNNSVVAIIPCPSDASRSFDNLGRINEYWKHLVKAWRW